MINRKSAMSLLTAISGINLSFRLIIILLIISCTGCLTSQEVDIDKQFKIENKKFLQINKDAKEVFRVLLTSDDYIISQMKYGKLIRRADDPGGDKYMRDEIKKLNKIDEAREGVISIWLYPDSGSIMKVRPQKPTYIIEIDRLLTDDIQRWNFVFPRKAVQPTRLDIRYRVVLRKRQTDEEIIKEVRQKMRERQ